MLQFELEPEVQQSVLPSSEFTMAHCVQVVLGLEVRDIGEGGMKLGISLDLSYSFAFFFGLSMPKMLLNMGYVS